MTETTPNKIVYADITRFRNQYYDEQQHKRVAISEYLEISTAALDKWEPISTRFHCCGGWQSFYSVEIVGGPDNGKFVDTYPWHHADGLEYGATVYNGPREEYEKNLGYFRKNRKSLLAHWSNRKEPAHEQALPDGLSAARSPDPRQ